MIIFRYSVLLMTLAGCAPDESIMAPKATQIGKILRMDVNAMQDPLRTYVRDRRSKGDLVERLEEANFRKLSVQSKGCDVFRYYGREDEYRIALDAKVAVCPDGETHAFVEPEQL